MTPTDLHVKVHIHTYTSDYSTWKICARDKERILGLAFITYYRWSAILSQLDYQLLNYKIKKLQLYIRIAYRGREKEREREGIVISWLSRLIDAKTHADYRGPRGKSASEQLSPAIISPQLLRGMILSRKCYDPLIPSSTGANAWLRFFFLSITRSLLHFSFFKFDIAKERAT